MDENTKPQTDDTMPVDGVEAEGAAPVAPTEEETPAEETSTEETAA